jgi:hypothetical protein
LEESEEFNERKAVGDKEVEMTWKIERRQLRVPLYDLKERQTGGSTTFITHSLKDMIRYPFVNIVRWDDVLPSRVRT